MNLKKNLGIATLLLLGFVAMVDAQYYGGRSSGGSGKLVGIIIGVIAGVVILFLVCRELICWYYKINRLVELMEQQNYLLNSLNNKIASSSSSNNNSITSVNPPPVANPVYGDTWTCKKCSESNPATSLSCKGCGEYR